MNVPTANCGKLIGGRLKKKKGDSKWRLRAHRFFCNHIRGFDACKNCLEYRADGMHWQFEEFFEKCNDQVWVITRFSKEAADKYSKRISNRNSKLRERDEEEIIYRRVPILGGSYRFYLPIELDPGRLLSDIDEIDFKVLAISPEGEKPRYCEKPSGSHGLRKLRDYRKKTKVKVKEEIEGSVQIAWESKDSFKMYEVVQSLPGSETFYEYAMNDPKDLIRETHKIGLKLILSDNDELQDYADDLEEQDLSAEFGGG